MQPFGRRCTGLRHASRRCDPPRRRPHVRSRACRRGSAHPRPRCPTRSRGSCRTPASAELELALDGDVHVIADSHRHPELVGEMLSMGKAPSQPGRPWRRTPRRSLSSASPGEPIRLRRDPGCRGLPARPPLERGGDFARDVLGPARVGRGPSRLAENSVELIDDDGLDLRPAEIDSATRRARSRTLTAGTITAASRSCGRGVARPMAHLVGEAALVSSNRRRRRRLRLNRHAAEGGFHPLPDRG